MVFSQDQFHWKEIEKYVGLAQKVRRGDIYPRPLPHLIIVTRQREGEGAGGTMGGVWDQAQCNRGDKRRLMLDNCYCDEV